MAINFFQSKTEDYVDPLEQKHQQLITEAKRAAKNLALRNLPKADDALLSHISPLHSAYQNLLSVHVKRPAKDEQQIEDLEKENSAERKAWLREQVMRAKEKLLHLKLEREQHPKVEDTGHSTIWVYVLIGSIAVFESLLTHKALVLFERSNNLAQLFILAALVVIFIALPEGILRVYRVTKDHEYRFLIWPSVTLVVIGGFSVLASLRAVYLKNIGMTSIEAENANTSIVIHPAYLVILQCFLLLIAVFACSLLPTGDEKKLAEKLKKISTDIQVTEELIKTSESELQTIPERQLHAKISQSDQNRRTEQTESRIKAMHRETIGIFISENTLWRTSERPACFDQPFPELIN